MSPFGGIAIADALFFLLDLKSEFVRIRIALVVHHPQYVSRLNS